MKVVTVLGTRPEIIRLSRVLATIRELCDHVLVHTGQNFDPSLSDTFFEDLKVGRPDRALGVTSTSYGEQVAGILVRTEAVLKEERPDRLLVLGDTNSGLAALPAKRLGIPVYHMEAGNRCYDDRVPEETNRRVIDHCSDVLMPYTERSRQNLLREGLPGHRIFVTGNPIWEVLEHYAADIDRSAALRELGLEPGAYVLVTMHRAENVDIESRLRALVIALDRVAGDLGVPVVVSCHPRTRSRLQHAGVEVDSTAVRWLPPFRFFDFVALERQALCIVTDSGTVQEEAAIFGVPNVTIRDVTERPETIECGSNMLAGADPDAIARAVRIVLGLGRAWRRPEGYDVANVSGVVAKILLGYEGPWRTPA